MPVNAETFERVAASCRGGLGLQRETVDFRTRTSHYESVTMSGTGYRLERACRAIRMAFAGRLQVNCPNAQRTSCSTSAGRIAPRVISDCHFAVQLNHFIPGFLSYSVAVLLKLQSD
jgi:hypothetical protein